MFIRHEITITQDELKSLTKIISQEKKLGFELVDICDLSSRLNFLDDRYILTFSETVKKGGEKK